MPRLVQWVQPNLGASASQAGPGEGGWDPGACLFILYPFNTVVTKINTLKIQNLENLGKTKEETNGNLSPKSNFVLCLLPAFFLCVQVCVHTGASYPRGTTAHILLGDSVSSSFHTVGRAHSQVKIHFSLPPFWPIICFGRVFFQRWAVLGLGS